MTPPAHSVVVLPKPHHVLSKAWGWTAASAAEHSPYDRLIAPSNQLPKQLSGGPSAAAIGSRRNLDCVLSGLALGAAAFRAAAKKTAHITAVQQPQRETAPAAHPRACAARGAGLRTLPCPRHSQASTSCAPAYIPVPCFTRRLCSRLAWPAKPRVLISTSLATFFFVCHVRRKDLPPESSLFRPLPT